MGPIVTYHTFLFCARRGCTCPIGFRDDIQPIERRYCCAACAEGRGCDHRECDCALRGDEYASNVRRTLCQNVTLS
jgi:hypothetical protein